MNPTKTLHNLGQSLWLDNITRDLLNSGTLQRYIDELSVTGLTSNPTIFDHAIKNSADYDNDIARHGSRAKSAEDLFFELALADLTRAADLLRPIFTRTDGVDGWVSLEVSPFLAHDTQRTIAAARDLSQRGGKSNLFIKIPGTKEGLPAIEAAIFAGVPVNVTLLFSREQYVVAAEAYLRGVERRIEAGLNPAVASVASLFISRWDVATAGKVPAELTNRLGTWRISSCWLRPVFNAPPMPAPVPNAYFGRVPAPKIPRLPTHSILRRSRHPSRSTPCLRARSRLSPSTAKLVRHSRQMGATARKCWPPLPRPASTSMRWRKSFRTTVPRPSTSRGTT
jgi:transaldolase